MRKFFHLTFNLGLLILAALTVASFLGKYNFICELLSHFRPYFCLSALAALLLLFIARQKRSAFIALCLLLINGVQVLSLYLPYPTESASSASRIKFLQMNIWGGKNRNYDAVVNEIQNENADIIGISELTQGWWAVLQPKLKSYPYQVVEQSYGGICLVSRLPIKDGRVEHYGKLKRPRVVANVRIKDQWVKVIFAHPVIPIRHIGMRDGEFAAIAMDAKSSVDPVILAGDLNCTPWSYFFYRLQRDGKLRDTEKGFGYQPSWSMFQPLPLFCIDHCLASAQFSTVKRYNGRFVGSDHLPVITELSLQSL
jgi:endonuclease/exonuclease/phosphatase (EEP) superfamily protein YafD